MFQGGSCFPLSPWKNKNEPQPKDKKQKNMIGPTDQVKVILKSIGEQNVQDLSFLTSTHAIQYVKELECSKVSKDDSELNSKKFRETFVEKCRTLKQGLDRPYYEMIEIMKSLLKFNPFFRMTAHECIQAKIFDPVRDKNKEKILNHMHQLNIKKFGNDLNKPKDNRLATSPSNKNNR